MYANFSGRYPDDLVVIRPGEKFSIKTIICTESANT